jgi:hypothetical protein
MGEFGELYKYFPDCDQVWLLFHKKVRVLTGYCIHPNSQKWEIVILRDVFFFKALFSSWEGGKGRKGSDDKIVQNRLVLAAVLPCMSIKGIYFYHPIQLFRE